MIYICISLVGLFFRFEMAVKLNIYINYSIIIVINNKIIICSAAFRINSINNFIIIVLKKKETFLKCEKCSISKNSFFRISNVFNMIRETSIYIVIFPRTPFCVFHYRTKMLLKKNFK